MKNIGETIKLLVTIGFCVWILALVGGCAGPQLTPEQVTQINVECNDNATCIIEKTDKAVERLIEQRKYERIAKRDAEHDKILLFVIGCKQAGGTIYYTGPGRGRIQRRCPRGQTCIHKHARKFDYQCLSDAAVRDILRGQIF